MQWVQVVPPRGFAGLPHGMQPYVQAPLPPRSSRRPRNPPRVCILINPFLLKLCDH